MFATLTRLTRPRLTAIPFAAALLLPTPAARAGAQPITVSDIGSASITYSYPTQTPKLRRGMTSRVMIVKNLIDLVSFSDVSTTGCGQGCLSSFSNGRTNGGSGTGFIAMDVTVPSTLSPGSTLRLNVGAIDKFDFRVVHRGLVSSIAANPQPSTLQAGTPWVATVQGTDLGDPVVSPIFTCHTVAVGARTNSSVQFTLTRQASCSVNVFPFRLAPSAGDDPPNYRVASGSIAELVFSYVPPPPSGVRCISAPNIGQPVVTTPASAQVIVFGQGTPSPTNILVRWDSLTSPGAVPAPNNEWLVSQTVVTNSLTTVLGSTTVKGSTTTVRGLSTSLSFSIPGTHRVRIQAKNCGEPGAPSTEVQFSTRYQ